MNSVEALLREDLRDFGGYRSARSENVEGSIWLNANESAWSSVADPPGVLRRYPSPQPESLRAKFSALYAVDETSLLIGRGSDEGIDLLVRAFCAPGQGSIVVAPPVFGMYAVSARLHGVRVVDVPLVDGDEGLRIDADAMAKVALAAGASLVFLCSPGNPSGEALSHEAIEKLARRLAGRAIVVVDEAYIEYADSPSSIALLAAHDNLAVLRTLSKAHALAAARIGCVIASPAMITALRRCQAPYPVPQPCAERARAALTPAALSRTRDDVARACGERARMSTALAELASVRRVYPSQANFLLVRFVDTDVSLARLLAAGIVVRDMRGLPQLGDALRISIGTSQDNDRVLLILAAADREAA